MILYDTLLFTYILQSIFILDSESLFTCFMITSWSSLPPLIFNMNEKKNLTGSLLRRRIGNFYDQ